MFKFILLCFLAIVANASLILGKFECQNCENLNPQNIKKSLCEQSDFALLPL
ncbi:hypothetical protein [Campylobacter hyointestinalis]|uniref:hypothetical protein n=1 Tax=Campylobacter hyointestinalis TaxID=198 RepID=UPI0015EB35E1|nr:hypothetical protein [Campylobacter hyointestinalis]